MAPLFPLASKVRLPDDIDSDEVDLYSPGVNVSPPIFPDKVTISWHVLPAASLYAFVKSRFATAAVVSSICCVPVTVAGGNPLTEEPGLSPRSPVIAVAPVLVTVEPANIAKVEVLPGATVA